MQNITINGIKFSSPEEWTLLEVAKYLGIFIPTICHHEGLSSWGSCRLCIVEIENKGKSKLVTSCIYPVEDGLIVYTESEKVIRARKVILELLIAQCPTSKQLQDIASKIGLKKVRFKPKWGKCIYCGLCVRICNEQMMANAIGFVNRGQDIQIITPFDENSDDCRKCGGCIYVCPACTLRCDGPHPENILCGGCADYLQSYLSHPELASGSYTQLDKDPDPPAGGQG